MRILFAKVKHIFTKELFNYTTESDLFSLFSFVIRFAFFVVVHADIVATSPSLLPLLSFFFGFIIINSI